MSVCQKKRKQSELLNEKREKGHAQCFRSKDYCVENLFFFLCQREDKCTANALGIFLELFFHRVVKITTHTDRVLGCEHFSLLMRFDFIQLQCYCNTSLMVFDLTKIIIRILLSKKQPWMEFNCHCGWKEEVLTLINVWLKLDYLKFLWFFFPLLFLSFVLISVCVAAVRLGSLPRSYITIVDWHKRGRTKDLVGLNTLLCV